MDMMKGLKFRIEEEYDMSDLGEFHFFLGVHIEGDRASRIITMHQRSYIEEVLKRFGMEDCKPISTPLHVKAQLVKLTDEEHEEHKQEMEGFPYKDAVGSLMYAMVATKADIAFANSCQNQAPCIRERSRGS